jgi:hypothetical protein
MDHLPNLNCIPASASGGSLSPIALLSDHNVATPPSDSDPTLVQPDPASASISSQHEASTSSPTNLSPEHAIAASDISIAVSNPDSNQAVSPSDPHSSSSNVKLTLVTADDTPLVDVPSTAIVPMSSDRDDATSSFSITQTDQTDTPGTRLCLLPLSSAVFLRVLMFLTDCLFYFLQRPTMKYCD